MMSESRGLYNVFCGSLPGDDTGIGNYNEGSIMHDINFPSALDDSVVLNKEWKKT